ncbi:hypothetical protein [Alishewanella sp. HL-SH05]|uniref:hypothetical protein n=1 Tax=Alishewanella sp. HL-SH05 TaxID=3461145 RepID=UPI0040438E9C
MMTLSANILIQSLYEKKTQRSRLLNVREYLLNALQIPRYKRSLILVLGNGNESTNADALQNWLEYQSKSDPDFLGSSLGEIESRLLHHLEKRMEYWPE